ncbi:PKD domain-containing protein [Kineosporia sp. R_H_3]|uniref:PKD domain-containing protein n=1 Tax=Kineosporia sp. R_H_3 TaxID=1961848 RepID=UPI00117A01A9|nr:PKD domain-containing protein [Kineosporia sp. R_H_3]
MTLLPTFSLRRVPAGARRRSLVAAGAVLALAGSGVVAAYAVTPPPAHLDNTVGLKQVGPIDEANGFPLWYKDTNNVRLELCLDPSDPYCIMGDVPDPTQPVEFPDNFPDEAFWSSAEASLDAGGGEKALLVTAVEAAFGSADGLPAEKQQVSFGRIRVRAAGLIDDATYTVTHPYGTDTAVAEAGAVKGINVTEDIGSLVWDGVFDTTLGSRPGPFLKWDPNVAPAAPAGYLGDVTVGHAVVGSPYGPDQNVFRIEGPAGSFTGSADLCADADLGGAGGAATDDCIETKQFFVQGKISTRAGVQVTKVNFRDAQTSGTKYVDIYATSEVGQTLLVTGTDVSQTKMRADGKGGYFARVLVTGAIPADLQVANTTDTPDTVDKIEPEMLGDKVHITGATWDGDTRELKVSADSGDGAAALVLAGFPGVEPSISSSSWNWTVTGVDAPPLDVTVTSDKQGSDSEDVVVTGEEFASAEVVAAITPSTTEDVSIGQTITFDAIQSQGTITSYAWSISGGPGALTSASGPSTSFTPTHGGEYTVQLIVTGPGSGNTSTTTFTFSVPDDAENPVANAGPDQNFVVPTSVVTLNGSGSVFTTGYAWTAPTGVTLNGANTANPTFTVPVTAVDGSWTFTLTATGASGSVASTDTVTVTSDIDDVTVDSATYKTGGTEWRVRGTAQYCSANNTVDVYWNTGPTTRVKLGSTTPAGDLGVCGYDFRLKNTPSNMRPGVNGTVTVESKLGGKATGNFTRL